MSRDLMRCLDALDHAEGLCNGLDALIALMASCGNGDEPKMESMAELLGALHKDLSGTLKEANKGLRQRLQ
jgi:hypothetical protein